jgi:hypothetical protein
VSVPGGVGDRPARPLVHAVLIGHDRHLDTYLDQDAAQRIGGLWKLAASSPRSLVHLPMRGNRGPSRPGVGGAVDAEEVVLRVGDAVACNDHSQPRFMGHRWACRGSAWREFAPSGLLKLLAEHRGPVPVSRKRACHVLEKLLACVSRAFTVLKLLSHW